MKKIVHAFMVFGCIFAIVGSSMAAEQFITLATGGLGGALHIIAVGQAKLFNEFVKGQMRMNVQSTGGGVESTRLVGKGDATISQTVDVDVVVEGYEGKGRFKGEKYPDLRAICSFPYGPMQIATSTSSDIKSIRDFRGKRVCLGTPGGTGGAIAERILKTYGFDIRKDMRTSFHTITAQASALRDGAIDAVFSFNPAPNAPFAEMALTKPIRLISIDEPELNRILKEMPGSAKMVIPAGVYNGVYQDVVSIGSIFLLITNKNVSEEAVYNITKALWETLDKFHKLHPLAKSFQKETALQSLPIPLHRGAEKYYREKGMMN